MGLDRDAAVVLDRQAVEMVVQHLHAGGVVGGRGRLRHVDAADLQAVAGDVGEDAALHDVVLRAVTEVESVFAARPYAAFCSIGSSTFW